MTATEPAVAARPTSLPEPGAPSVDGRGTSEERSSRPRVGLRATLVAAAAYFLLSFVLWWHVWTGHPTSTTTCGCGDSSLFQWFLAWPAYALGHGLDPWYSTALFHPTGVNLLSNTAVVAVGVVLAPVTWIFGPIATFNVALGLAPVLSALAMFVLLRRWVRWAPAAFVGGLLYGFSPFVLVGLTDGHLMLSMAAVPPLVVWCLDELVATQRRSPVGVGLLLAVLVAVQFFVGTEVLVMVGLTVAVGLAVVLVYAARHREVLVRRTRHAVIGLGTAAVASTVVLAYPVWFALAGPAHFSGPVWGTSIISYGGTNVHDYLLPGPTSPQVIALARTYGGYQAPLLSAQYFGIGLLLVLVVGLVLWRRDLRLWLFALGIVFSVSISFGLAFHNWTVWRLFVRIPLMDNIIPSRFLLVTYLCAAVMLGLVVDHARADAPGWLLRWRASGRPSKRTGLLAGLAVSLLALLPIAVYWADGVPFTTQAVVLPDWFRTHATGTATRQVVLAFPVPFGLFQSPMTWQAVDRMAFDQVGGGGPGSIPSRAGRERAGQRYIGDVSVSKGSPVISPDGVSATRSALDGWGVTTIVIPDPGPLPSYERLHALRSAVVLMSAATGRAPARSANAWVWTQVQRSGPPAPASAAGLARCGAGPEAGSVGSIERSAICVVTAGVTA